MAKTITQINTATDTFSTLITQLNAAINAISTEVLTANTNANGASVTGNSFVFGIFGANTVTVWNEIRGGNVQTSNTLVIASNVSQNSSFNYSIGSATVNAVINSTAVTLSNSTVSLSITKPTSAQISEGTYFYNANGSWTTTGGILSNTQVNGVVAVEIDNFLKATYRSAEFTMSVRNMNANGYQMGKVLVLHDDSTTNAYITEYGVVSSNGNLGSFSANANATHIKVYFTGSVANTVVTSRKIQIPV